MGTEERTEGRGGRKIFDFITKLPACSPVHRLLNRSISYWAFFSSGLWLVGRVSLSWRVLYMTEGREFGGADSRFLVLWRDYHNLLQVGSLPCPLVHLHPIFCVAYYLWRVHMFTAVLLDCSSLAPCVPRLLHLFYYCN
jgi:hypothetical protein